MSVSAARTVVVPASLTGAYSTIPAPPQMQWPMAEPDGQMDYYADLTALLEDASDTIASVTVSVMPSGAGELSASEVSFSGGLLTVWLSGGVAARAYTVKIDAVTTAARTFSCLVGLLIDPTLAVFPLPDPPSVGFGTPVT